MLRVCVWCEKVVGEKEPLDDTSLTHGICEHCATVVKQKRDLRKKEKEPVENPKRKINLKAVAAAIGSPKTPVALKKGLIKKYGHLLKNPAQYCKERLESPKKFAKKSFRTIPIGKKGHLGITACPRGYYHKGKCTTATHLQAIRHPAGEAKCPMGGRELNPGAKWHEGRMAKAKKDELMAKTPMGQALSFGKYLAHLESADVSRRMGINPKHRSKWYVGIYKTGKHVTFAAKVKPTQKSYPALARVIGPFDTHGAAQAFRRM